MIGLSRGMDNLARQCDFQGITMPVQVSALTFVIRNAMTGIEFQTTRDLHNISDNLRMSDSNSPLSFHDHSRDAARLTYVYPVLSRRAGGLSLGINLNPNNACNWHCVYCQVPNLSRGSSPPIDLALLNTELSRWLDHTLANHEIPKDIAFSGNGEPTSAPEFPEVMDIVTRALFSRNLSEKVICRLITNGSLIDRNSSREGLKRLAAINGEVWFKVDGGTANAIARINGVRSRIDTVNRRLALCAGHCTTWIQTCLFKQDGCSPSEEDQVALLAVYKQARHFIAGVHLYGLARPSLQPEASRLTRLSSPWMEIFGNRVRDETGLIVQVSP